MNIRIRSAVAGLALVTLPVGAIADDVTLETDQQKLSYAMGFAIGSQIKSQFSQEGMDLNVVARAIADALNDAEALMSRDEIASVMQAEQQRRMAAEEEAAAAAQAKGDEALARGEAFLKENGGKEGVTTTDSGLQYKVITAADGDKPAATDTVVVHYRGTLLDGTEFDSSYKRNNPAEFSLGGIILGWQEVLQLMSPGARWEVYIPSHLAYGPKGAGGLIGPNETLIFEIELLEIK